MFERYASAWQRLLYRGCVRALFRHGRAVLYHSTWTLLAPGPLHGSGSVRFHAHSSRRVERGSRAHLLGFRRYHRVGASISITRKPRALDSFGRWHGRGSHHHGAPLMRGDHVTAGLASSRVL